MFFFFFSSRRRHTRSLCDWSSDVCSSDLEAGAGVARAVRKFFPHPGTCSVYAGKGHNGGDALVAAEHLKRAGWKIDIHLAFPENECGELTRKKDRKSVV